MASFKIYTVIFCLTVISVCRLSQCSINTRFHTEGDIVIMTNEQSNIKSQHFLDKIEKAQQFKDVNAHEHIVRKRRRRRSLEDSSDQLCSSKRVTMNNRLLKNDVKKKLLSESLLDPNNTQSKLLLLWSGQNTGVLIAVTSNSMAYLQPSTVYRSTDNGRHFKKINNEIDSDKTTLLIQPNNGLQKHALDSTKIYIIESISYKSIIYISHDSGSKWRKALCDFDVSGQLVFHPKKYDLILTLNEQNRKLYISEDGGFHWKFLRGRVVNFLWSEIDENVVFATVNDHNVKYQGHYQMVKIIVKNNQSQMVLNDVQSFGTKDKFIYASVQPPKKKERMIMVSIDEAKTWIEAQVPRLTSDRFFSVLDMSEDLIFLHVDNPGDTGHGTLYTSGARGLIYTESLLRHLYPNTYRADITDFYKVLSMDGVYLASKILENNNIITVISYDRGGEWKNIPKPKNGVCSMDACNLQVYNSYSASQGIKGFKPVSVENAPGLIIVHGHVSDSLQKRDTDVYISNDGGYSFFLALEGPHIVQIGDHGGLIVALPINGDKKTLKFSTDEGNCWIDYKFTEKDIKVSGLLTEPGNKAMTVSIWGYTSDTHEWTIVVIDFASVINDQCSKEDYEEFYPHKKNKLNGCYLGLKKILYKLRKDSVCKNGYGYSVQVKDSSVCECTKSDYECDYGYKRNGNGENCEIHPEFKGEDLFICDRGHIEEVVSEGYRLIPGDKCKNGFKPKSRLIDMNKVCCKDKESHLFFSKRKSTSAGKIIFCVAFVLIITFAIIAFIWRRYFYKKSDTSIRYSSLTDANSKGVSIWAEDQDEPNEFENDILKSKSTTKNDSSTYKPFHDDSDVDMLE